MISFEQQQDGTYILYVEDKTYRCQDLEAVIEKIREVEGITDERSESRDP